MNTTSSRHTLQTLRAGILLAVSAAAVLTAPTVRAGDPAQQAAKAGDKAATRAADQITDYREESSDVTKAKIESSFAQIDAELAHLDALADSAPDETQKREARVRHTALRERRDLLKKNYNQARYDAFKADVKLEFDRVSGWAKDTFSSRPAANTAAAAAANHADRTSDEIANYRDNANAATKAEVKAALARLDADIAKFELRIDAVADPARKTALQLRLKELKERRQALGREFAQARFDALVADVKTEWSKLTD